MVDIHCAKSVRIQSFSGSYFLSFRLNAERFGYFSPSDLYFKKTYDHQTWTAEDVLHLKKSIDFGLIKQLLVTQSL